MFLHVSVIHSVHGGGGACVVDPGGGCVWLLGGVVDLGGVHG